MEESTCHRWKGKCHARVCDFPAYAFPGDMQINTQMPQSTCYLPLWHKGLSRKDSLLDSHWCLSPLPVVRESYWSVTLQLSCCLWDRPWRNEVGTTEEQCILWLTVCQAGILDLCDLHSGQINARESPGEYWEGSGTNILSIRHKLVIVRDCSSQSQGRL